jgi:hypothetical protein
VRGEHINEQHHLTTARQRETVPVLLLLARLRIA